MPGDIEESMLKGARVKRCPIYVGKNMHTALGLVQMYLSLIPCPFVCRPEIEMISFANMVYNLIMSEIFLD